MSPPQNLPVILLLLAHVTAKDVPRSVLVTPWAVFFAKHRTPTDLLGSGFQATLDL